jgi:hypothetical protein
VLLKGVGRDSKQQGRKWDGGKEGNAGEEEGVNNLDLSGCLEGLRSLIQRSQGTVASDRFIQAVADFPALILLDFLPYLFSLPTLPASFILFSKHSNPP